MNFHLPANEARLKPQVQAPKSLPENGGLTDIASRSWSRMILGFGHWEDFFTGSFAIA